MDLDPSLILNAIASGLLLGCLYAMASVGLAISFGMLDVVNIAHPAIMVAGAFAVALVAAATGLDPLLAAFMLAPAFYLLGAGLYRLYFGLFERRGDEAIRGLAFFFGLMFIIEVALVMTFGPDQHFVAVSYASATLDAGPLSLPLRMLVPAAASLAVIGALFIFLKRTFTGRAIAAVARDHEALRFLAIDPIRIKRIAFGLSIALAVVAGGALVVVQPVDPSTGHVFIGRMFAIVIMGGMGSLPGCVLAALIFGVIENLTATLQGPSWSPAVAFGLLLLVLAFRPQGLFGSATS